MAAGREIDGANLVMAQRPLSEPPPSGGPASGVLLGLLPYGDASEAPPSSRLIKRMSEPPPSGPVSGVVAPILFRGDGGPGFWIRGPETRVEVVFDDASFGVCKVIRLNPTGAWFIPDRGLEYPLDEPVEITIRSRDLMIGPLRASVVAPPCVVQEPIFGLVFTDVPFRMARQIVEMLRDLSASGAAQLAHRGNLVREEIGEPTRIRSIVRALAGVASRGYLDGNREAPLRLVSFDEAGGILVWLGDSEWGDGPFVLDVTGYNSVYRLHFTAVSPAGEGHAMTALPRRIERLRQRQYRRSEVNGALSVALYHPLWARLPQIKREVRDVSFGGICFDTSLDDDLLFPGLSLPLIEVREADGEVVRLKGEVRSVGPSGDETVARVSVTPYSWRDESRWNRLVARMLYPTTKSGEEWAEPVWDLFRDSGYFNLSGKAPEHFDLLKSSYLKVDQRGVTVPGLFCHAVFPSERGVEGTVSIMKVYRSTWMLHQLAKRKGTSNVANPRQILRDLYTRAFEHTQTDQNFRWIIAYAEATVRWNQMSHFAFAQRHADSGKAMSFPFQLMEVTVADRAPYVPEPFDVGPGTPREVSATLQHIRRTRPDCYVEALDFVPEHADLATVSRKWSQAGFLRERATFVARRGNTLVAAAIVECGETGANLFRLVDNLRLIPLVAGGEGAFSALMDAARDWFRQRGKEAFVYFRESEDPGPIEVVKLRDLGEGRFWVIAAELLPEFLEHVFEVTSPRVMTATQAEEAAPGVRS